MAALLPALCASASRSSTSMDARHAWQQQYRRPAEIPFPKSNPYSDAKFKLGRALFFDPILSGSEVRSCASCHNPGLSWADGQPRAIGEKQLPLPLRTPTLLNVAWIPKLGWDGHFRNLEEVAMGPITATGNTMPTSPLLSTANAQAAHATCAHLLRVPASARASRASSNPLIATVRKNVSPMSSVITWAIAT